MVYIIDEVMGRGKTIALINHINAGDIPGPILFVTPYCDETKRIVCACPGFVTPERENKKFVDTKLYLADKKNVVATHYLFGMFDDDMCSLVHDGQYTLIMDETPSLISTVNITPKDSRAILSHFADVDEMGQVIWTDESYTGKYKGYMDVVNTGSVYYHNDNTWLKKFRPDAFDAFRDVYLMTYMFSSSTTRQYFDLYQIPYTKMYIGGDNPDNYSLCSLPQPQPGYDYRSLIQIERSPKMNEIGDAPSALSKNWYLRHTHGGQVDKQIWRLRANTTNFFRNRARTPSSQNLWTTFSTLMLNEDDGKEHTIWREAIAGDGYIKGFLQCTARGILLLCERPQHGRFSRLTRPGQKDRRVGFAQFDDAGFHVSADVFHKEPPFSADFGFDHIMADNCERVNVVPADLCFFYKLAEK